MPVARFIFILHPILDLSVHQALTRFEVRVPSWDIDQSSLFQPAWVQL